MKNLYLSQDEQYRGQEDVARQSPLLRLSKFCPLGILGNKKNPIFNHYIVSSEVSTIFAPVHDIIAVATL